MRVAFFTACLSLASATVVAAQTIEFSGNDSVFGVVATATAKVTVERPFLIVTIDRGVIRSTALASSARRVTGFRVNLVHTLPSNAWDVLRKSERVPIEVTLDHLDSVAITPRKVMIPIDGVDNLRGKWLVFEVDVDGTPPGFTYSHSQKLEE